MNRLYTIASNYWRKATMALMMLLWLLPMTGQAQTVTIGANTGVNTETTYPAAYGQWFTSTRHQFLYTAPELSAANIGNGAAITSIGFNIVSLNGAFGGQPPAPHQNFTVWIANTTQTTLTSWVPVPGTATPFYGGAGFTQTPTIGTNTFTTPGAPFIYTGGNLVIQISHSNGTFNFTANPVNELTTGLSFTASRWFITDGAYNLSTLNDPSVSGTSTSRPRLVVTFIPPIPCASPITGGTAIANPTSFCTSGQTALSVTGGTGFASGLSYQWQMSTNGGTTWTDIPAATQSSLPLSPTVTSNTLFRRQITCVNGGGTDFSVPASFDNVLGVLPYAKLPYVQDFETWQDKCSTKEIPVEPVGTPANEKYWVNTPSTGNLSWRRQNEGNSAGWTNPTNNTAIGNITPISGTGAACFHAGGFPTTGTGVGGQQGWLDLHVNMNSTFVKEVRFLYRNRQQFLYIAPIPGAERQWIPVHTDQMEVLLSTDGGLTFPTTIGTYGSETLDSLPVLPIPTPTFPTPQSINKPTNWKRIAVKIGAVSGTAVIRFRATTSPIYPLFTGGVQSDIGIDDVQVVELKPCSGTPIAGNIFGNFKLCDPGKVYLSVLGSEDLLGGQDYEFLWERSDNGGTTWYTPTDGTSATLADYTTGVLSTEPLYRRRITCKNGGASINTAPIQILQVRPTPVPVTVSGITGRYVQLFENWIDGCREKQIPDVAWKNTPNIGNRSWRKNQDVLQTATPPNVGQWFIGFVAPTAVLTSFANGPGSTGCAEFFSRGTAEGGNLDLYANFSSPALVTNGVPHRKALQFYTSNTNGTDNLSVQFTDDPNATNPIYLPQGQPIFASPNPAWARRGYFIESTSANFVARFNANGDTGFTNTSDIGIDSLILIALPPCNARPHGGQASASPSNFCQGSRITISVSSNAPTVYASDDPAWATDDGHLFRWQVCSTGNCTPTSPDWVNIPQAQGGWSGSYTFTALAPPNTPSRQYRRKIMCPVDTINMVAFSNAVILDFPYPMAYAAIPYYQGFEDNWASGGTCAGGTTPTQAAIRPVSPNLTAPTGIQDPANVDGLSLVGTPPPSVRGRHWRSTSENNRGTWRRTNGTTTPTGFTTGGGWNAYGRAFALPNPTGYTHTAALPTAPGAATFNGFGGGGTRTGALDLYLNASGTQMKQLRFRYRNPQRPTPTVAAFTPPQWPEEDYNTSKDKLEIEMSFNNGLDFSPVSGDIGIAPTWLPYHFNFSNDAPQTVIRFKGTAFTTQSPTFPPRNEGTDLGLDEVYVVYVNDCVAAGTLVGGTSANTVANTMPDFNFCYFGPYAIYVTGASDETHYGFTYQWQYSPDGVAAFTDIPGATLQNYIMQTAQVGFYQRVITCTATGSKATSTPVQMAFANPVVYATIPYRQDFENWIDGCHVTTPAPPASPNTGRDRPDQSWVNSPFTGQTAWRRQNEGRLASWQFNFPEPLPTAIHGQGCAAFHNYFIAGVGVDAPPSTASSGKFDLYVNCSTPGTKQLRFWYTNPDIPNSLNALGNNDKLQVFFSTDAGATFQAMPGMPTGGLGKQDGWLEYAYFFNSNSPATIIRFQCNWQPDDSDIGLDEVRVDVLSQCVTAAGITGGTALPSTVSGNACTTLSLLLYVTNSSSDTQEGLEYQWEYSLNGGTTWITATGATQPQYETSPLATTLFRRITKCTASGVSATSAPYTFYIASSPEYATLPYKEDFERWADACADDDVPVPSTNRIHWVSRPFNGNNAWLQARPTVVGSPEHAAYVTFLASAGWTDLTNPDWLASGRVVPATGSGAAAFHSFSAPNRGDGSMWLYLNTTTADPNATKLLQFDYSNPDYPIASATLTNEDKLEIYVSKDGGATFTTTPILILDRTKDLWETKRIVFDGIEQPFLNAQYVVFRFRAISDNGGTDMGIDNLSFVEMPKFDAGVTAIEFNRCSPVYGRVVIEVSNFGSEPIQNFPVQFTIGTNTFVENFPFRLERFQKGKFEFATPINIASLSTLTITAKTNLAGDLITANDSRTVNLPISAYAGLTHASPTNPAGNYVENFDAGLPANWSVRGKIGTSSWFSAVWNDVTQPITADEFPFNPFQFGAFGGGGLTGRFIALDDNKGGTARTFDSDRLVSPSFDFTNYTNIQVAFDAFNDVGPAYNPVTPQGGSVFFEYSLDDGLTFTTIVDEIEGNKVGGNSYESPSYTLGALEGKSKVRFAFRHNDRGTVSGGAAIDNFRIAGTALALPNARFTTPLVPRAFVNHGTDAHIVYRFNVESKDANTTLSDVILKTGAQDYKVLDFKENSFRLFVSNDSTLSANDRTLGTVPVVAKGNDVVFSCLNYVIPKDQTNYFFFTVDVASKPTATLGDSIQIQLPNVTNNFITISGQRTAVNVIAGGHQIIADPNTPPTAKELVFDMKRRQVEADPSLVLTKDSFKFADANPIFLDVNLFRKLRITSLSIPQGSKLQYNNANILPNQEINVPLTGAFNIVFTPELRKSGQNFAFFVFKVYDGRDWSVLDYTARINVLNDEVFIPTLFSPNADGNNDFFKIMGDVTNIDAINLKVVDRNNNPMYESSNPAEILSKGWDGKKEGKDQPAGAYMWYIEGTYKNKKPIEFNGKKTGIIRLVR